MNAENGSSVGKPGVQPENATTDHVILDLEATCWEKGTRLNRMETIEFGAVRLEPGAWDVIDEFSSFVRPVSEPVLSDFCRELTGIREPVQNFV